MADLSSAADHGSGHLLGHVLGDGQAVPMAAYHVGALSVYMEVLLFISFLRPSLFSLASAWITARRQTGHQSASPAPYRALH